MITKSVLRKSLIDNGLLQLTLCVCEISILVESVDLKSVDAECYGV